MTVFNSQEEAEEAEEVTLSDHGNSERRTILCTNFARGPQTAMDTRTRPTEQAQKHGDQAVVAFSALVAVDRTGGATSCINNTRFCTNRSGLDRHSLHSGW